MDHTGVHTDLLAIEAVSDDRSGRDSGNMISGLDGRHSSSQVRFTLASELGDGLDGAWWPHTVSIARELPDLIHALEERLGPVIDIGVNWSPLEGVPDLDLLNRRGVAATPGRDPRHLRVITLTGSRATGASTGRAQPNEHRAGQ